MTDINVVLKNTVELQEKIGTEIVKQMYYTLNEISGSKQEYELTKDIFCHAYLRILGNTNKPINEHQIHIHLYGIYNIQGCFVKLLAFDMIEVIQGKGKDVDSFQLTEKGQKLYQKIKLC